MGEGSPLITLILFPVFVVSRVAGGQDRHLRCLTASMMSRAAALSGNRLLIASNISIYLIAVEWIWF